MYGLRLSGGDLSVVAGHLDTVTGSSKVVQDLRGALLEPVGNDRFHPGWGSTLQSMVGNPLTDANAQAVQSEVSRVVSNYATVQTDALQADQAAGNSNYSTDELLSSILSVQARRYQDQIQVTLDVGLVSGASLTLNEGVTQ